MADPTIQHTVKLFGYLKDITQNPVVAADVRIILKPTPQYTNNILFNSNHLDLLTNEEGYFEVVLPGGLMVTVVIPITKFQVSGLLPLSGELNVLNLGKQY